ncbi:MAG: D-alanine--D-alanine ligase [Clostridiales bacterium]|nr:D-alanine--D-alanine ligase [Clostridiales bacterium]
MNKINLGVIFGGMSTEHEVSVVSGTSILKNLNKEKYNITPIYIDKEGIWNIYEKNINEIEVLSIGDEPQELRKIENPFELIKKMDVIFPVLHGLYGEDGTIQGLLELMKVPYVGCKVLGSSICMDKVYTKVILEKANIEQAKYMYLRKYNDKYIYVDGKFNEEILCLEEVASVIIGKLGLPVFIKPSNSGSSVGVNKANSIEELKNAIEYASKYDEKILIEENINGREVECAIIGNEDIEASCVGEILPAENYYTFDAKYNNSESKVEIPANIDNDISEKIRKTAKKAFKAVNAKGLSRVDFFIEKNTNRIILNEINTMPGFTKISMYPQLWEKCGKSYSKLLDELIENSKKI